MNKQVENFGSEVVDVTYTVKESVAKGRRLMRNTVTGKEFWVADESESAEDTFTNLAKPSKKKKSPKEKKPSKK